MERRRVAEQTKGIGKPKVGGPFQMKDFEGKEFSDEDMKGGFSIVSPRPFPFHEDAPP